MFKLLMDERQTQSRYRDCERRKLMAVLNQVTSDRVETDLAEPASASDSSTGLPLDYVNFHNHAT
jgi:regulator of sirC expression with transglutaminase-like and TPR domain